ncbi:hypothetical protein CDAR_583261 [Caerostris darwini]|uniref:Uncharacterized protein n=1 Tax=Caerostris darwini TaxID=1538125 RepID=A0AAV4R146_9ARAC|nr:hypothetical protein CDAR_583261 [Caerostris darwini]
MQGQPCNVFSIPGVSRVCHIIGLQNSFPTFFLCCFHPLPYSRHRPKIPIIHPPQQSQHTSVCLRRTLCFAWRRKEEGFSPRSFGIVSGIGKGGEKSS